MNWQPIETAPREGWKTRFLAMDETGWVFICHWNDAWLDDSFDVPDYPPIKWMPLPKASQ